MQPTTLLGLEDALHDLRQTIFRTWKQEDIFLQEINDCFQDIRFGFLQEH